MGHDQCALRLIVVQQGVPQACSEVLSIGLALAGVINTGGQQPLGGSKSAQHLRHKGSSNDSSATVSVAARSAAAKEAARSSVLAGPSGGDTHRVQTAPLVPFPFKASAKSRHTFAQDSSDPSSESAATSAASDAESDAGLTPSINSTLIVGSRGSAHDCTAPTSREAASKLDKAPSLDAAGVPAAETPAASLPAPAAGRTTESQSQSTHASVPAPAEQTGAEAYLHALPPPKNADHRGSMCGSSSSSTAARHLPLPSAIALGVRLPKIML